MCAINTITQSSHKRCPATTYYALINNYNTQHVDFSSSISYFCASCEGYDPRRLIWWTVSPMMCQQLNIPELGKFGREDCPVVLLVSPPALVSTMHYVRSRRLYGWISCPLPLYVVNSLRGRCCVPNSRFSSASFLYDQSKELAFLSGTLGRTVILGC